MNNQKTTNIEKPNIRLIKCTRVKDGHTYHNLYLQVGNGNPIAFKLAYDNIKVRNLLLAVADDCEIKTTTIVRPVTEKDF